MVTGTADNLRTGWYSDQPQLSPDTVRGSNFGRIFDVEVDGSVYAQPLVGDGVLLVATENNKVYGFDAATGKQIWTRDLGRAFDPTAKPVGCRDLVPTVGVTGTPVVDLVSQTAYLFSKTYDTNQHPAWLAHALDLHTGAERPGFPVPITGHATNDPTAVFDATFEMQRPALLLLNGVVYAAFGGHCDARPYRGFIVGVTSAGKISTLFTTAVGPANGAGIWQSGGGLVSDANNQIIFATGNGYGTDLGEAPIVGAMPPRNLGETVARVTVQPNGGLTTTDFFTPADAKYLDGIDSDLGSGGPVGLPSHYFGTSRVPHLLVQVGKQGLLRLLNRDALGGFRTGVNLGDDVVAELMVGGVWGRPSVWGGDGGYVYVVTNGGPLVALAYGMDGTGQASLGKAGISEETFGYTSGSPVVTSDGVISGTAVVWAVGAQGGDGGNGVLYAYDAVPAANGMMTRVFRMPIGTASKFAAPGVSGGRVYVGTRDGHVMCFGSPVQALLSTPAASFGQVIVGQSKRQTVEVTARAATTITALHVASADFTVEPLAVPLPLENSATFSIGVTFAPTKEGPAVAAVAFDTTLGPASITLSGTGIANGPKLVASYPALSFSGTAVNTTATQTVTVRNVGSQALTFNDIALPSAPFSAMGLPAVGATLDAEASITLRLMFAPTSVGSYLSSLVLTSSGGQVTVGLTGTAALAGRLSIDPPKLRLEYGEVTVGQTKSESFTLTNVGQSDLTITRSKPPTLGPFRTITALDEGTTLKRGESRVEKVEFKPVSVYEATDSWSINANDGQGVRTVSFHGQGRVT